MMTAVATNTQIERTKTPTPVLAYRDDQLEDLEMIATTYGVANTSTLGKFKAAFAMASGIRKLREAINDEMLGDLMQLAGTSLGFKTDLDTNRDGKRYTTDDIRDCFIEATLRGARPVGNEFNIIANRCYLTKEFYMRAFGELPGVTNVAVNVGLPRALPDNAQLYVVRVALRWLRHAEPEELPSVDDKKGREFHIKYRPSKYAEAGTFDADQLQGKALRKAFKAAYEQVTGSVLSEDEDNMVDGVVVSGSSAPAAASAPASRTSALAAKVAAKALPNPTPPAAAPSDAAPTPPAPAESSTPTTGGADAADDGHTNHEPLVAFEVDSADAESFPRFQTKAISLLIENGIATDKASAAIEKARLGVNEIVAAKRSGKDVRAAVLNAIVNGQFDVENGRIVR